MGKEQAATIYGLSKEKATLAGLLEQSHDERAAIQKELNKASKYVGHLEGRVLEAN